MPPKWALNPLTGSIDPSPPGSKRVSQSPQSLESELSSPPTSQSDLSESRGPELDIIRLQAEDGLEGGGELEPGPLEKTLCLLRLYIEHEHRETISRQTCNDIFTPRLSNNGCSLDKVYLFADDKFESEYGFKGIQSCGNKTVPIYVFPGEGQDETIPVARSEPGCTPELFMDLETYLRGAWFRTYRSDIDCNEFIARVISPAFPRGCGPNKTTPDKTEFYVGTAVILNRDITDIFAQAQVALQDGLPLSPFRNTYINPLFRALAILFNESDYDELFETGEDDEDVPMENLKVILVSTGLGEGLSAPIEKLAVELSGLKNVLYQTMTLGEAIEKVMRWEERERKATLTVPLPPTIALNGHKPHRYLTNLTNLPYGLTKGIRWEQGPILGPSSAWVDPDKYRYPKGLAKTCLETIKQYNESKEAKYRVWLRKERLQDHCRAWLFWYRGLYPEEGKKTDGKKPSPEN